MSEQFTKYERTWIDGLNRGDVSVADDVFAPNCVIHMAGSPDPNLSLSGFKQMVAGLLAAFPDFRLTIEDQVITADKVATRWTAEGTHTGPLGDTKPTGRRVRIDDSQNGRYGRTTATRRSRWRSERLNAQWGSA